MSHRIWEIQYAGSPKVLWSGVKPTPKQLATADQLGIQVSPDDTFATVASAILERVGDAIGCPPGHGMAKRAYGQGRAGHPCCPQDPYSLPLLRTMASIWRWKKPMSAMMRLAANCDSAKL